MFVPNLEASLWCVSTFFLFYFIHFYAFIPMIRLGVRNSGMHLINEIMRNAAGISLIIHAMLRSASNGMKFQMCIFFLLLQNAANDYSG